MMKKITYVLVYLLTFIELIAFRLSPFNSIAADETYDAVYFGSLYCTICQNLETEDLAFERLEAQGVMVQKIILEEDSNNTSLFRNYQFTFDVSSNENW